MDRTCTDQIDYKDKNGNSATCFELSPKNENNICYLKEETCDEYYKDCTVGNRENCESIKPLNQEKNGFNPLYECKFSESCTKELKMCKDAKENEFDEASCQNLKVTDENNKICRYDEYSHKCKEIYKTCTSINSAVAEENTRKEEWKKYYS